MAKSREQDKAEGALYKVGGRVLQAIGSLTGDRKKKIKGRLGRGKGPSRIEKVASEIFLRNRREPTKKMGCASAHHRSECPSLYAGLGGVGRGYSLLRKVVHQM